jgi:predicted kinase
MVKLLMLKGLVASGKSTYAKELVEKGWVRVNKDDLRAMMHNSHHGKGKEARVVDIRNQIVHSCLVAGQNIVVDDTSFNPIHEKVLREIAQMYNAEFEIKFFDTPLEVCIERDSKREKPVGEVAIRTMYNQYLAKEVVNDKYIPDTSKPMAFIFDIDGTLALMKNRSPYDYTKVLTDLPNKEVIEMSRTLAGCGYTIIVVSGRNEVCREDTRKWLHANRIPFFKLFMRGEDDKRKDTEVKKEIFFRDIAPCNYILGVFDDRDSVVAMWRSLGLTCYQVAPGAF